MVARLDESSSSSIYARIVQHKINWHKQHFTVLIHSDINTCDRSDRRQNIKWTQQYELEHNETVNKIGNKSGHFLEWESPSMEPEDAVCGAIARCTHTIRRAADYSSELQWLQNTVLITDVKKTTQFVFHLTGDIQVEERLLVRRKGDTWLTCWRDSSRKLWGNSSDIETICIARKEDGMTDNARQR